MRILELKSDSSEELKQKFKMAYLEIWNSDDSLPFLSFSGQRFTLSQISSWVCELHESNPIKYLFSEENDEIMGIVVLNVNYIEGFELLALGVNPNHRSKGIGSKLIEQSCEYALEKGFLSVKTTVFADNVIMQRLVLKHGFFPVSIEHGKRYDGMAVVNYVKRIKKDR